MPMPPGVESRAERRPAAQAPSAAEGSAEQAQRKWIQAEIAANQQSTSAQANSATGFDDYVRGGVEGADGGGRPNAAPAPAPPPGLTEDEQIEQELGRLRKGNLAYNTPQTMKTGKTARVMARIGSALNDSQSPSCMPPNGLPQTEAVRYSRTIGGSNGKASHIDS